MRERSFTIKMKKYGALSDKRDSTVRALGITLTIMLMWFLFWALVLKMCDHESLIFNYYNLRYMTLEERFLWDLIPFNYRGPENYQRTQMITTLLNCFVLAPVGVTLCYSFKKINVFRDAGICLLFILFIESIQMFTTFGNFATEDFITNMLSYFVGLAIYAIFFRPIPKKATKIMLSVFVVIGAVIIAYTLITTVNSAELIFSLINRPY